jgi:hypothetical protein
VHYAISKRADKASKHWFVMNRSANATFSWPSGTRLFDFETPCAAATRIGCTYGSGMGEVAYLSRLISMARDHTFEPALAN